MIISIIEDNWRKSTVVNNIDKFMMVHGSVRLVQVYKTSTSKKGGNALAGHHKGCRPPCTSRTSAPITLKAESKRRKKEGSTDTPCFFVVRSNALKQIQINKNTTANRNIFCATYIILDTFVQSFTEQSCFHIFAMYASIIRGLQEANEHFRPNTTLTPFGSGHWTARREDILRQAGTIGKAKQNENMRKYILSHVTT